jgi:microcystin-dependent protein
MAVTIVRTTNATQLGSLLSQASASTIYLTKASASITYLAQAPGIISQYIGATAPAGYLICDGSPVSRSTYSALWDVLRNGTSSSPYGNGNGTTTFNLPNLQGRVPVGRDPSQLEFDALADTGGAKTHQITTAEMPVHNHVQDPHNHGQDSHGHGINPGTDRTFGLSWHTDSGYWVGSGGSALNKEGYTSIAGTTATNQATTATNQNSGTGNAHNNLQPFIVVQYIIKY